VKGVLLALLATLAGLLMVGGGVYGLVQEDDDEPASRTATVPAFPELPASPAVPGSCDTAAKRDPRLGDIRTLALSPAGRETGSAELTVICNGEAVVLAIRLEGLRNKESSSYHVWVAAGRSGKQIGTLLGSGGDGFGSVTIGPELDTSAYERVVITRTDFGVEQRRPRGVIFSGGL
jgi:hypothetical protein